MTSPKILRTPEFEGDVDILAGREKKKKVR